MVTSEAIKAVNCLGLYFGAADVIWNDKEQRAYVLEVNTAPGLEGTTLENYANAFTTATQD
jgi:D-alanine-D-alanine ligase-like ATP-grasp enzyme